MGSPKYKLIGLGACLFLLASVGFGDVITFNNAAVTGSPIPNGYAGLDWNNFYTMNTLSQPITSSSTDALNVGTSYAYNNGGGPAFFSSPATFTFTSAIMRPLEVESMELEVLGMLGDNIVDRALINLNTAGEPVQQSFNWTGINSVRFIPAPGTDLNAKFPFALEQIVINVASVPEPTSLMLLASGIGLAFTGVRKRLL